MRRKNRPKTHLPEENSNPKDRLHYSSPTLSGESQEDPPRIDFLSPEFNVTDDLDDNMENYREFQSLEGIVTADMRYHEKRKRQPEPSADLSETSTGKTTQVESEEKPEHHESLQPLTISSKGRTLIISPDLAGILDCAEFLNDRGLTCTLCLSTGQKNDMAVSRTGSFMLIEADSFSISGSFGGFGLSAEIDGGLTDLSALPGNEIGYFDLVLDLQAETSYSGEQLPAGYYAPETKNLSLDEALSELPEMRGRFRKPRFILLDKNRCYHGQSREHGCQRCLDTCPVGAIRAENGKILVNGYHCQGCGACALACPADALQVREPDRDQLLTDIQRFLSDTVLSEDIRPDLVICDHEARGTIKDTLKSMDNRRLAYEVDDIARIGIDFMLAALAYGAGSVTLVCDPQQPAAIRSLLEKQADLGQIILEDLHIPTDRIRYIAPAAGESDQDIFKNFPSDRSAEPVIPPADTFPAGSDRRTLLRLAAAHLCKSSPPSRPAIPLPADTPFGTISIDREACSLCMACVGACPSAALAAGGETPRISFTESHCHQCGICAEKCPENAIRLTPRLLYDIVKADQAEILREAEPFRCVECGIPFAAPAMIESMIEKLNGHWMYSNDQQLRRLKMCRTCRTRDALTTGDYR